MHMEQQQEASPENQAKQQSLPGECDLLGKWGQSNLAIQTIERQVRTFILFSPSNLKLCSASFATPALPSSIYSTKAMSFLVGIRRTSCKFGYWLNSARSWSFVEVSGRFWRKRILLGGRYSSGIWTLGRLGAGAAAAPSTEDVWID